MPEQVRIGLIGGGPWARRVHAPALAAHAGVDFVGVWVRRPAVAAEIAAANGATAFDDVVDLVAAVDVVAFAVPPAVQAELAVDAARAGRHVNLEKPIAPDVVSAARLADAVADAGVASAVVLVLRYAPETRQWLAEASRLGGWHGGNGRWLSGALLGGDYVDSTWRHESGALADIGPHAIDLMDAALGPVRAVVAARRAPPDLWHLLLEHDGGEASTITLSLKVPLDPSAISFDVYGEAGLLELAARQTSALACYATMLGELIAMVRGGQTEHPCDVQRGLHLQRIIDDAYHLARADG